MRTNSKYKDSVFSFLFSDPALLRQLYGAISGIHLPPDIPVDINTLTDVIYMDQINDVSFTIDNRLVVLIEHQSTINRNMPLRLLMYIARIFEKIIDRKKLYQRKLEKIPTPEFIVLYNGREPQADHEVLQLSDAFRQAADLQGVATPGPAAPVPALELVVNVFNINQGHNTAFFEKCEALGGYSFFIDKLRECERSLPKEAAMQAAITYCLEHNVLKDFLETHSSEVFNMLLTEWNTEEAKEVWFKEGWEEGISQGIEEGIEQVARNALAEGISLELIQTLTGLNRETLQNLQ